MAGRSPRGTSALGAASPRGSFAPRADQAEAVTLYNFEAPDSPRGGAPAAPMPSGADAPAAASRKAAALAATGLTAGPKSRPMARNDRFTKLSGDVNQCGDG